MTLHKLALDINPVPIFINFLLGIVGETIIKSPDRQTSSVDNVENIHNVYDSLDITGITLINEKKSKQLRIWTCHKIALNTQYLDDSYVRILIDNFIDLEQDIYFVPFSESRQKISIE